MRKNGWVILSSLLMTLFLTTACGSDPVPPHDTQASTETASATESILDTETLPVTETIPATESETFPETAPVSETEKLPDGVFESPTCLDGFTQGKNAAFLEGVKCEVVFDDDGSLRLSASIEAGARFSTKLEIDYAGMMKSCCTAYTSTGGLPNGDENKYRAVVVTVEGREELFAECDLFFSTGRRHTTQNTILPSAILPAREADADHRSVHLIFDMGESFTADYLNKLVFTWGYGSAAEELHMEMKLDSIELYSTVEAAYDAKGVEAPVVEDRGAFPLEVSADKLDPLIHDIFSGNTVMNETVMFLDAGDEKELLYDIDTVISVTSYDGRITYREGVDYTVRDGKLVALEGGSMPIITREKYYGADSSSLLITLYNKKRVYTHWGEGREMTDWQVNVTYTHKDEWDGFDQPCEAQVYANLLRKLQNGEDVTIIFYGDSCTYGAASSFSYGYAPHQYSYAILMTNALADLFGYTVRYINPGLPETGPIPSRNYVAGDRGTITYINPSVGGWGSADARVKVDSYLLPFIEKYGCDLFVSDIGGNDGSTSAENTRRNVESIIDKVLSKADDDICVVIMSTLVNNPNSVNGWYGTEFMQEPQLLKAAAALRERGVGCGTCCMTSTTLSVLEHVEYHDISGNNINHPNDFWARIYACTLFENIVGYGNLT